MHPYSDPLDHGRTYNQSRLKSRGNQFEGVQATGDIFPSSAEKVQRVDDFLRPEDPTRPRSVGYSKGHVRNLLKLDVYGEKSSQEAREQREMGLLPPSPNVDRYKYMNNRVVAGESRGSVSTASTASSNQPSRRPRTTGHTDSLEVFLPLHPRQTLGNGVESTGVMESNSFAVLGLVPATPEPLPTNPGQTKKRVDQRGAGFPQGTLGYAGPAVNKEDISLVDAHSRGVDYFNGIVNRKMRKMQNAKTQRQRQDMLRSMQKEAALAIQHIERFEENLQLIRSKPRPI